MSPYSSLIFDKCQVHNCICFMLFFNPSSLERWESNEVITLTCQKNEWTLVNQILTMWGNSLFLLTLRDKTQYGFLQMLVCPDSSFCPKFRYFADQKGPQRAPHETEFWVVPNTKIYLTNSWSSKSRWKN